MFLTLCKKGAKYNANLYNNPQNMTNILMKTQSGLTGIFSPEKHTFQGALRGAQHRKKKKGGRGYLVEKLWEKLQPTKSFLRSHDAHLLMRAQECHKDLSNLG